MADRLDIMSNVKLGRFRSQLKASSLFSYTEEFWYNEVDDNIYIYIYIYVPLISSRSPKTLGVDYSCIE